MSYLATQAEWDRLLLVAPDSEWMGLDTETYGHDVKESSPSHRARVDVWSVGLPSPEHSARGYRKYTGYVLPETALWYGPVRQWLASSKWVVHNSNHDRHALARYGIRLTAVYDTLEICRLLWPGLHGYGLKKLRSSILGKDERDSFKDIVTEVVGVTKTGKWKYEDMPIQDITPGHLKFQAKVDYAAEDAVDAPELREMCLARSAELSYKLPEMPW